MGDLAGAGDIDEREWISATEAAELLQLCRMRTIHLANKQGYTTRKAGYHTPPFFLRSEIKAWSELRQLRRRWLAKYKKPSGEKRWTEKIDTETAEKLFITAVEAAELLGVTVGTVRNMAQCGRLFCYQHIPGHCGSRLWFSRRAVLQTRDDPARLKRQESYRKRVMGKPRGGEDVARKAQGGVPKGWLTTRETAERLGVSVGRVFALRTSGRLRGEHIWRKNKPTKFWYFPDYEVDRCLSWREQAKEAAGKPLIAVPNALPVSKVADLPLPVSVRTEIEAPRGRRSMEYEDLAVAGPEPQWACDDVDLRRAFFLLDAP